MSAERPFLLRRVGFWRAMIELSIVINLVFVLPYALGAWIKSPWLELLGYVGMALYAYAAWRLAPGTGGIARRIGRLLLWLSIFILINGLAGWLTISYVPYKGTWLGMRLDDLQFSLATYMLSASYLIASLFLSARLLLAAWGLGTRRLRWRLAFTYMLVGVLTLIFVPIALLLYVASLSLVAVPTIVPPGQVAPTLAAAVAPAVADATPDELAGLLAGLLDGTVKLPMPEGEEIAEVSGLLQGVRRLSLLARDGTVLASVGREPYAVGAPPDSSSLGLILPRATTPGACVEGYPAAGAVSDTAVCAVGQAPTALLVVESNVDSSAQIGAAFGRLINVTLLGSSVVLNLFALVVIGLLPVGLGVGYLLARGLTRRIERLDQAAASLAAGDLGSRVPAASPDEIGRLGLTFNSMAAQLEERERALADAAARSDALLRSNKRLVADVSHELRNPLATLRGYLEALEHDYGDKLPERDMAVIRGETQRLTALVEDLFTLARAEAQQLPLTLEAVDVGAMVNRVAETLAPLARREREIEVVAQVAPGLPAARADQVRLEQVLRNLAQNAVRHTPPGGIIAFEATLCEDGAVALAVADTGLGIAPEDLPLVFERFYRGDSSRARETGGAGLGLALVRELVDAMGGAVSVESTPGRGSRFTVCLRRWGVGGAAPLRTSTPEDQ